MLCLVLKSVKKYHWKFLDKDTCALRFILALAIILYFCFYSSGNLALSRQFTHNRARLSVVSKFWSLYWANKFLFKTLDMFGILRVIIILLIVLLFSYWLCWLISGAFSCCCSYESYEIFLYPFEER